MYSFAIQHQHNFFLLNFDWTNYWISHFASDWTLGLKIQLSTIFYWISYWILKQSSLEKSESCSIFMHAYWIFQQKNAGKSLILLEKYIHKLNFCGWDTEYCWIWKRNISVISGIQLGFGGSRIRTGGSRDGHGTRAFSERGYGGTTRTRGKN